MKIIQNLRKCESWCLDEYRDREAKARIHGVQSWMQTCEYFFKRLTFLLLRHSDNLSTSLQAIDLCAAEAQKI